MDKDKMDSLKSIFITHFGQGTDFHPHIHRDQVPNWNSLNHVLLFVKLEKTFGIKFSGIELAQANSVEKIINLIDQKLVSNG